MAEVVANNVCIATTTAGKTKTRSKPSTTTTTTTIATSNTTTMTTTMTDNNSRVQPKIVIVGAGIAGIAAAEYLTRNGFTDFKVLEAANRTGGRIWTISDTEGRKAEMGANWIHGIEKNPIYQIADSNHLLQLRNKNKTLRDKRVFLQEDGMSVCGDVLNRVDLAFGQCMNECEAFYKDDMPIPNDLDSVGDYIDQDLLYHLSNMSNDESRRFSLVYDQRVASECVINGCNTLSEVSLSDIGTYEELPGIHYTIPPGFERVVDILKSKIPSSSIVMNHPVRCIYWDRGTKNCDKRQYPVCVECENRELFYADHVITTVSLGVLKAACSRMFSPPMPKSKMLAIDHMGFGVVDKVILEFDRPVIDLDTKLINLLWDSKKDLNKRSSRGQNLGENWVHGLTSFEVVHKNVLLGWLCGNSAIYMESLSEEQVAQDCVRVLCKFLQNPNIPMPKKVIRTRWGNNPYTRGSYSFVHVNAHIEDIYTLQEPLQNTHNSKPQVLFAGEATHECFYSTTHGALLTGWREAQRIKSMYSSSSPPSSSKLSSSSPSNCTKSSSTTITVSSSESFCSSSTVSFSS